MKATGIELKQVTVQYDTVSVSSQIEEDNMSDYCYEDHANFWTWIWLSFESKLFYTGKKRPLTIVDLGESPKKMQPRRLYEKFSREWAKESQKPEGKRSVLKAMLRANGIRRIMTLMITDGLAYLLQFLPSLILEELVMDLEKENYLSTSMRWIYTLLLVIVPTIGNLMMSHVGLCVAEMGVAMRTMASEAIYRKALVLSSKAKDSTSAGELVNVMASDTYPLMQSMIMFAVTTTIPVVLTFCLLLVSRQLGQLTWIAIGLYAIMLAGQIRGAKHYSDARINALEVTDQRVTLMSEIISGIRIVKYYCWEKPFSKLIQDWRSRELVFIKRLACIIASYEDSLMTLIPQIVPLICFSLYPSVMNQPLSSSTAFSCISLFKILQTPFYLFPWCLSIIAQLRVSFKRIGHFLCLEEFDLSLVTRNPIKGATIEYKDINGDDRVIDDYDAEKDAIVIRDGYFAWGVNSSCLRNINVHITKGSLVAVVGRIGCGKSSFLSAILGEMTKNSGAVVVNGSMSLSAQQAWLVNDTVRNNIIFGKPYDEAKYKAVIRVCCLEDDLKMLAGGDQCEIGERGINVSGGQKARISIARCCYSDSDIVVMDDPIAAVDPHVGRALFHNLIRKKMDGRTRILVTNATQYLKHCDQIIVIDDHTLIHQGTFDELKAAKINFTALSVQDNEGSLCLTETNTNLPATQSSLSLPSMVSCDSTASLPSFIASPIATPTEGSFEGELITEETKQSGNMKFSLYRDYFHAFGHSATTWVMISFTLVVIWSVISQFWIQRWADDECFGNSLTDVIPLGCENRTQYYINGFTIVTLFFSFFAILRLLITVPGKVNASKILHGTLLSKILRAPIAFFDVTPCGRLLNRFNRDMSMIDLDLPTTLFQLISMYFSITSEVLVILFSCGPTMIPLLVIACLAFLYYYSLFTKPNMDFQRLEAITRSPIFGDFQAVLGGRSSIRTYGHQQRFIENIEGKIQKNSLAATFFLWAYYWFLIRASTIATCINGCIAALSNVTRGMISPGVLGAALSSSMGLNNYVKDMVDMLAQTESNMIAMERIQEYIERVPAEPSMIMNVRPPKDWPTEGRITINNAKLKYRDGPMVMKGVNLEVEPREKVGVVGRTGAGKSTLMVALFRITDLCEGSVLIDGVDLSKIGLEDVRRALCIIPQDPVLFSATVRFNLDPFNESSDEDIWSVLERVHMKEVIMMLPFGLDDNVQEGGNNFSVGERQLICMARALLRKPKILILDEATASLDNATDAFLQEMIREQFAHCSSLMIAHRLNTIMDADRVCVMDCGVVAEFDTPYNLLHNTSSIFYSMVMAANDPSLFDMVPGCQDLKSFLQ